MTCHDIIQHVPGCGAHPLRGQLMRPGLKCGLGLWMWSLDVLRLPDETCEASALNSADPEQVGFPAWSIMIPHVWAWSPPKVPQMCIYTSLHQERYGWSLSCSQRFVARSQSKGPVDPCWSMPTLLRTFGENQSFKENRREPEFSRVATAQKSAEKDRKGFNNVLTCFKLFF